MPIIFSYLTNETSHSAPKLLLWMDTLILNCKLLLGWPHHAGSLHDQVDFLHDVANLKAARS